MDRSDWGLSPGDHLSLGPNKSIHQPQPDVKYSCNSAPTSLVICTPFKPNPIAKLSGYAFLFINAPNPDTSKYVQKIVARYHTVMIEETLQNVLLLNNVQVISSLSHHHIGVDARVLFLASNDTHAHFFNAIAKKFNNPLFAVPDPKNKAENADLILEKFGWNFCFLNFEEADNETIENFSPNIIICANDWSPEYNAIKLMADSLSVPIIAVQEGPQDWEQKIDGKDPRKYRNADVFFAQGYRVLQEIMPPFSVVTGNPKNDSFNPLPLPDKPCVLINCNFTYDQYEEHRETWMLEVIRCCNELKIQYFISQHPRDYSDWSQYNVVKSSALAIGEQLKKASIIITRFSNIPYEALGCGRPVIYFNPHQEPMTTFRDRNSRAVIYTEEYNELRSALASHTQSMSIDCEKFTDYLIEHCTSNNGDVASTIHNYINAIVNNELNIQSFEKALQIDFEILFSVIIGTHEKAACLQNTIESVLSNPQDKIPFELIIVGGSGDKNLKILEPYICETVKYLCAPRTKLPNLKNTGIAHARGKYVIFLDQDATVGKDWLQSFYTVFCNNPYAVACGGAIKPIYVPEKPRWIKGKSNRFYGGYRLGDSVLKCDWVPDTNTAWRVDLIKKAGRSSFPYGEIGAQPGDIARNHIYQEEAGSCNLGNFSSNPITEDALLSIKKRMLMCIAAEIGAELYYSPNAVMYHHIDKEKLTVKWLKHRYYMEGLIAFRRQLSFESKTVDRKLALQLLVTHLVVSLKCLGKTFSSYIFHREKPFYQNFFMGVENFGVVHEALKYIFRFDQK